MLEPRQVTYAGAISDRVAGVEAAALAPAETERPRHPQYGRAQSGAPRTINGVTFRPYRVGVNRSAWLSDDYRCRAGANYGGRTYSACADGLALRKRFRSLESAMRAAVGSLPSPSGSND